MRDEPWAAGRWDGRPSAAAAAKTPAAAAAPAHVGAAELPSWEGDVLLPGQQVRRCIGSFPSAGLRLERAKPWAVWGLRDECPAVPRGQSARQPLQGACSAHGSVKPSTCRDAQAWRGAAPSKTQDQSHHPPSRRRRRSSRPRRAAAWPAALLGPASSADQLLRAGRSDALAQANAAHGGRRGRRGLSRRRGDAPREACLAHLQLGKDGGDVQLELLHPGAPGLHARQKGVGLRHGRHDGRSIGALDVVAQTVDLQPHESFQGARALDRNLQAA